LEKGEARTAAYRANLQDEIDSAALYRELSEAEENPELGRVYARLAEVEKEHAAFWEEKLREAGQEVPPRRVALEGARHAGSAFRPTTGGPHHKLHGAGRQPRLRWSRRDQRHAAALPRALARLLRTIAGPASGGLEGGAVARLEGTHRATSGNALRAAVLGANDGLLSNFSLVMGVAGAALSSQSILITGLAGLLAGAGSMAMGEWISVQSSRELYERQISIEAEELKTIPDEEEEELALIYIAKGVPEEQARRMASRILSDERTALDTLAHEELGIDPEELGGSAWTAALTSFVLFAIGAIVPVVPFGFLSGMTAVALSVALSTLALFGIGALITLMTGRSVLFSGMRQVVGLAAAALTYGVGLVIGTTVVGQPSGTTK
jgi:VIT1/CCC1 family predicted Fe2+/Mn2+ transporter